jgi:sugar phosphate isomerase/epimerase
MKLSVFYEHIAEAAEQENKPVSEICKEVVSYGISAVEIENTRLMEGNEVLDNLKNAGLSISCMYGFFDFAHEADIRKEIEMVNLAEELQIQKIMLIPGLLKEYEFLPVLYQNRVNKMISVLGNIVSYAKKKNIMVVLEDFDNKKAPYATAKQLLYFLKKIPDLYCAFDTGNFLYSGEDSLAVLPEFIDRIGHVHCKDRKPNLESCAVGLGCIKMKEIVDKIVDKGYNDYFAIEHFGVPDQLLSMERSAKWFSEI